jgi:hypothetical protein
LAISNNATCRASAPDDYNISPYVYIYNGGVDPENQLRHSNHVAKVTVSEQFELVSDRQLNFRRQKDRKPLQAPPMIEQRTASALS